MKCYAVFLKTMKRVLIAKEALTQPFYRCKRTIVGKSLCKYCPARPTEKYCNQPFIVMNSEILFQVFCWKKQKLPALEYKCLNSFLYS